MIKNLFQRCFICNKLMFTWFSNPGKVEMYCGDGKVKGVFCKGCENIVQEYSKHIEEMKNERDSKKSNKDEDSGGYGS